MVAEAAVLPLMTNDGESVGQGQRSQEHRRGTDGPPRKAPLLHGLFWLDIW